LGEVDVALVGDELWLTLHAQDLTTVLTPYGSSSFLYDYEGSDGLTYWSRVAFEDDDNGDVGWLASAEGVAVRTDP
jgi:hypothetical protein